jgi:hypothetical protein
MAIGRFDATPLVIQPIALLCCIPQILGRLTPHYASQSDPLAPHHSVDSETLPETLTAVFSAFVLLCPYGQHSGKRGSAFKQAIIWSTLPLLLPTILK